MTPEVQAIINRQRAEFDTALTGMKYGLKELKDLGLTDEQLATVKDAYRLMLASVEASIDEIDKEKEKKNR